MKSCGVQAIPRLRAQSDNDRFLRATTTARVGGDKVKPEPEEIDLATYKRLTAKLPRKRAKRPARLDIPRAEIAERDGLTALIRRGWSVQTPDCVRYRLYRPGQDTGLCATAAAACEKARELER